jgi:nitrogen fixation NifU-like protein
LYRFSWNGGVRLPIVSPKVEWHWKKHIKNSAVARTMDENEIYQEHILEHYESPYHKGSCEHCTHCHEDKNPLCGDVVRMELRIVDGGKIREIYFDGEGCCISQAAASMLVELFDGKSVEDVKKFTAEAMLKFFGPRLTPNRQKCALLPWRVLQAAIYSPCSQTPPFPEAAKETLGSKASP